MNNNSILIDRYLQNEMSADEKTAFEKQLAVDKNLQEELTIQQQIIKAAETAGLKNEFAMAIRKRIIIRRLIRWGLIIAIGIAAFLFYAFMFTHNKEGEGNKETKGFTVPEMFDINNATDTIIETKDGVVFAIPAYAFNSNNNSNIQLEIKTALTPYDIMQNGLSTMSNNDMLQTAGMFYINGFSDGKQVLLQKEIAVSVPAKEINPAMQLFDGVQDSSGRINWVNPKPVQLGLRTYDITTLDFYPPAYIPTLKALQKDYQNKKYTDSLYYSFSGYPHTILPWKTEQAPVTEEYKFADTTKKRHPDTSINDTRHYEPFQIDPAKIRAIWDAKFDNTILATKEFEERLHFIHTLCESGYLEEGYLRSLNKPLYKSDQFIADNTKGEIRKKFLEFAARKDGSVMIADGLQEKLTSYFQQKSKAYKEAVEKTWAKYQSELQRLNSIADSKSREQELRNFTREENNFKQELCINLTDAYKQIGIKRNCNDTIVPPADKYYNVTITTTGWKNLDAYVLEATANRQSMEYKDPATGKVAKIIYREVNIKITNEELYDRVLVYLIPDSLNSFQMVPKKENSFKENLNSLFKYEAVVLAYKDKAAYFYRQNGLQAREYIFNLSLSTDEGIRASLQNYSPNKAKELNTEFEYRLFEQKEILRQLQVQKNLQFRMQVAISIFSCGEEGEGINSSGDK
jgi:hypothetical protein